MLIAKFVIPRKRVHLRVSFRSRSFDWETKQKRKNRTSCGHPDKSLYITWKLYQRETICEEGASASQRHRDNVVFHFVQPSANDRNRVFQVPARDQWLQNEYSLVVGTHTPRLSQSMLLMSKTRTRVKVDYALNNNWLRQSPSLRFRLRRMLGRWSWGRKFVQLQFGKAR